MPKAVNKVEYGGRTLIDLSGDTLTDPSQLRAGVTAHDRSGASIVGTFMEHFAGYGEATKVSGGDGYEVTISGLTSIADGTVIAVKFPSSISAAADALLNVNSLGARHLAYEGYILGACTLNLGTQKICQLHSQGYIPKDSVVMLVASKAVTVTGGTEQDVWTIINPQETCLFGNCTTAAGTAAKTVAIPGVFEQFQGLTIKVWFSYSNTASNPTLSVNGLPAAPIIRNSSYASSNAAGSWQQMAVVTLTYIVNGGVAYWSMNDWNNSTYSNASLGHVYGTCSAVDSGTGECTVVASNYQLGTGAVVSVAFSADVPAAATMNVNSKGAKAIFHNGAALAETGVINSGDIATFVYDGDHYVLLAVDSLATNMQVGYGEANVDDIIYEHSTVRVDIPDFKLRPNSLIVVRFDDTPSSMNYISVNGSSDIATCRNFNPNDPAKNYIKYGDVVLFVYDGTRLSMIYRSGSTEERVYFQANMAMAYNNVANSAIGLSQTIVKSDWNNVEIFGTVTADITKPDAFQGIPVLINGYPLGMLYVPDSSGTWTPLAWLAAGTKIHAIHNRGKWCMF